MILWGRPTSVNVQKVLWALAEYGVSPEIRLAGGRHGGLADPEFRCLTPTRKVPVLQDGDVAVWESNAILRYLARRYPEHPLSRDLTSADPWMDFGTASLQPPFIGLFWQLVRMRPEERSEATIAAQTAALSGALDGIEDALSDGRDWLAGPGLSLADIAVGTPFHRIDAIAPDLLKGRDRIASWVWRMARRPGWAAHVATNFDELRPGRV